MDQKPEYDLRPFVVVVSLCVFFFGVHAFYQVLASVPETSKLYKGFAADLGWGARWMMSLSNFFILNFWFLAILSAILMAAIVWKMVTIQGTKLVWAATALCIAGAIFYSFAVFGRDSLVQPIRDLPEVRL